ncbi:hypothetical protein GCM10017607_15710 [Microbacterium thalassium]|nr:hypothetical protein [Microbacterium thalassium]GLK24253.1 hypothetical protein GCM10017607_15710 [Microbacterium thalassium]
MCVDGGRCSSYAPGHALHLIQARLSSATPAEWIDGIVVSADAATGEIVVAALVEDRTRTVWSGAGAASALAAGTPVALHGRYDVLAVGTARYNVAPLN